MQEYIINVSEIEELQMIKNVDALNKIFARAKTTIVGGEKVLLIRKRAGKTEKFDELTTEQDLSTYKNHVFKYLDAIE